MPYCFQLTRTSDPKAGPVDFCEIDQELCEHFDVPCHPKDWLWGWYDCIGLELAIGHSWEDIEATDYSEGMKEIAKYLEENFTVAHWHSRSHQ